ncbi:MAG TPA: BamA/TamA family outer membrane protein, partial [Lacipirellulaceae bacterium]|nr:BamA/TamA family outer membrane protein [Lacipirellulaceae bacterium]
KWRVGRIIVHIGGDNPHTRIQTALNRVTLRPGQIMDIRELKASERRLMASSVFHTDAATGVRPKITFQIPEDADLDFAERPAPRLRGQSPEGAGPPVLAPPSMTAALAAPAFPQGSGSPAATLPPPLADGTDVHVHCEDYAHYLRWVAAETEAQAVAASAIDPTVPDPAVAPAAFSSEAAAPATPPATPGSGPDAPPSGEQPGAAPAPVFRGQSPEPAPTGNWVAQWQGNPPAPSAPGANPYAHVQIRGQNPGYAQVGGAPAPSASPGYVNQAYAAVPAGPHSYAAGQPVAPYASGQLAAPQYGGQAVRPTGPETAPTSGYTVEPAQYSPNLQPPAGSIYPTPLNPQGPLPGYSVMPQDPMYAAPGNMIPEYAEGTVDVRIEGQETQTGRLMLGVGVNSDAGVVGNIVVDERNFDWTRLPTSWEDVRNGTAFRGDGQRFRIDASPGSEVNRYLVSWQNPYFMDRPVSLSLSGSYFDRRFRDWDEQRVGGRVGVGYQWVERDLSATLAYRGENVKISNISAPGVVPDLDEVVGDNALHGFRLSVIRDTRDNAFLATQGHYLEVGAEQVIGTFDYPRIDIDARKYWLLHERPDHSGRHVFSLSSTVGFTGTHTPIYEHYFAGGFATLRGFDFRGASPVT